MKIPKPIRVAASQVRRELEARKVAWQSLEEKAQQIILFGSWATCEAGPLSDIDLLCVGEGARLKNSQVDIVWKTDKEIHSDEWLGSELANHIAAYGFWLSGKDDWTKTVFLSEAALNYKAKLIASRMKRLRSAWESLAFIYRLKHVIKLRRDIQRLGLMESGMPVPPTIQLDAQWSKAGASPHALRLLLQQSRSRLLLSDANLDMIASLLPYLDWKQGLTIKA